MNKSTIYCMIVVMVLKIKEGGQTFDVKCNYKEEKGTLGITNYSAFNNNFVHTLQKLLCQPITSIQQPSFVLIRSL